MCRAHRRFVACNGARSSPKSNVCLGTGYIWAAWPLYTLIARIRWPASNPIVLFEREIWELLRGGILGGSSFCARTTENVVALAHSVCTCVLVAPARDACSLSLPSPPLPFPPHTRKPIRSTGFRDFGSGLLQPRRKIVRSVRLMRRLVRILPWCTASSFFPNPASGFSSRANRPTPYHPASSPLPPHETRVKWEIWTARKASAKC